MKLTSIPLLVTDFPAAVRFWSDVAKLPLTYSDEAVGFTSFDTGSTTLLLLTSSAVAKAGGEAMPVLPQALRCISLFRWMTLMPPTPI